MPAFNLLLADSVTQLNTKDILTTRPIVLFYFSPYCPYCRAQIEEIIHKIDRVKDIQFYVFTSYSFKEMKHFYREYQIDKYPNIQMGIDQSNFFADYFEAPGLPYMAIYGKDKKLRKAFVGNVYSGQIKSAAEN
jgi:thiol-disulfide isomerase/thioredoxin